MCGLEFGRVEGPDRLLQRLAVLEAFRGNVLPIFEAVGVLVLAFDDPRGRIFHLHFIEGGGFCGGSCESLEEGLAAALCGLPAHYPFQLLDEQFDPGEHSSVEPDFHLLAIDDALENGLIFHKKLLFLLLLQRTLLHACALVLLQLALKRELLVVLSSHVRHSFH